MEMSPDFQNDLGFLRRTGFRKYFVDWASGPVSSSCGGWACGRPTPTSSGTITMISTARMLAKWLHTGVTFFMNSGGNVQIQVDPRFERIDRPFTLDRRIDPIPPGSYSWAPWA